MPPVDAQVLLGAVGAAAIAVIVDGVYGAFPGLSKAARPLVSIAIGVGWTFLVAYSVNGDYRLAPIDGLLVGIAAANPRAVVLWSQRKSGRDSADTVPPPDA